jgi:hypothetical protein
LAERFKDLEVDRAAARLQRRGFTSHVIKTVLAERVKTD